jgi:hypothetical protein
MLGAGLEQEDRETSAVSDKEWTRVSVQPNPVL